MKGRGAVIEEKDIAKRIGGKRIRKQIQVQRSVGEEKSEGKKTKE